MARKIGALSVLAVVRELRRGRGDQRPIGVAGARELVPILARELREGGDASAVVEDRIDDVALLVWVGPADEDRLRAATRAHVPIVAVTNDERVPYVLATNHVAVPAGSGFPIDAIAEAIARVLGLDGTALASRLPVLRRAVCEELIRTFSRRNALISAAVFIPGVDMPVLTLNQIRLVLRIALAYGQDVDAHRSVEIAGVVGAGFGLRALARELLDVVPVAGWLVKGGVAYTGTRAIGEAAMRYFEQRTAAFD